MMLLEMRRNMMKKYLHISLFIMLFTSSLVAVEFSGVSINKVGMLPFVGGVYLCLFYKGTTIRLSKESKRYVIFLVASCISAFVGIAFPIMEKEGLMSVYVNYIIQVVFLYLPMIVFVCGNQFKKYDLIISLEVPFPPRAPAMNWRFCSSVSSP